MWLMILLICVAWIYLFFKTDKKDTYDSRGFTEDGRHKNGTKYDDSGYDKYGYNSAGFDKNGFDIRGYDKEGYNKNGYDRNGWGRDGYHLSGYDKYGYDRQGYDRNGFDREGFNKNGFDRFGWDKDGYNADGFDRKGYNKTGYNRAECNTKGVSKSQYVQTEEELASGLSMHERLVCSFDEGRRLGKDGYDKKDLDKWNDDQSERDEFDIKFSYGNMRRVKDTRIPEWNDSYHWDEEIKAIKEYETEYRISMWRSYHTGWFYSDKDDEDQYGTYIEEAFDKIDEGFFF